MLPRARMKLGQDHAGTRQTLAKGTDALGAQTPNSCTTSPASPVPAPQATPGALGQLYIDLRSFARKGPVTLSKRVTLW